jgi:hypothetical protein
MANRFKSLSKNLSQENFSESFHFAIVGGKIKINPHSAEKNGKITFAILSKSRVKFMGKVFSLSMLKQSCNIKKQKGFYRKMFKGNNSPHTVKCLKDR